MIDILKELSQIAGYLTGLMAFFALIIPKSRNFLVKWLKKNLEIDKVNKSLEVEIEKSHDREKAIENISKSLDAHVQRYKEYTEKAAERDIFFLRAQIDNIYHKFMPLGYITARAKSDVAKAWELYVAMGGNSYAKGEVEELLALPTRF